MCEGCPLTWVSNAIERLHREDDGEFPCGLADQQTVGCIQASSNILQGSRIDAATPGEVAGIIGRDLAQEQIIRVVLKVIPETDGPRSDEKAAETQMAQGSNTSVMK
jgi:hypothetical protein